MDMMRTHLESKLLQNITCTNCGGSVDENEMNCVGCGSQCIIVHGGMIAYPIFKFKCGGEDGN